MSNIATWLLATAGAALILTQSSIAAPLREWLDRAKEDPWRCDWTHSGEAGTFRCLRSKSHAGSAHRISGVAPQVRRRARVAAASAKLVSCPMCSGFWLGMGATVALGERGVVSALAHGFGGSVVSALAVTLWLALSEAQSALGLWRYLNPPPAEPAQPKRLRVPRFMRPAFWNPHERTVTCEECRAVVAPTDHHSCVRWVVAGANPPDGTLPSYANPMATAIVCGCGEAVLAGGNHVLDERCGGVTSADIGVRHER